ncbi:MAG: glycosyl transferase family 2 [Proteobacteria bacterium]|nr:glycosyl transferase family 2 [Pseudomonadota bacterium]
MHEHPFRQYSTEILRFDLGEQVEDSRPLPDMPPDRAQQAMLLLLKAWRKEPRPAIVLTGLGDGTVPRLLDAALPPEVTIIISERDTRRAREALQDPAAPWNIQDGRTHLLADSSPMAHFMLWSLHGLTPGTALLRAVPGGDHRSWTQVRQMFNSALPLDVPRAAQTPPLTLAAILAPDDPGLPEFFAQVPPFVHEVLVLWDGQTPPETGYACAAPVRHLARPLNNDFAAQRNALLSECRTKWILSLDADERLSTAGWEACRRLAARGDANNAGGFYLPRKTLARDAKAILTGYGLWPDLQLRLFRWTGGLGYERPIHERLTGIRGPFGIALNTSILHLSHVLKTPEELRRKLAGFDSAGAGRVNHTLSQDYPTLPTEFFPEIGSADELKALILPFDPS